MKVIVTFTVNTNIISTSPLTIQNKATSLDEEITALRISGTKDPSPVSTIRSFKEKKDVIS